MASIRHHPPFVARKTWEPAFEIPKQGAGKKTRQSLITRQNAPELNVLSNGMSQI
jgi:hypothetical protein